MYDQFNGNIKGMRWLTQTIGQQSQYVYSYDRNNWLVGADFDPGANTSTAYDVGPILYDANGNIQKLVRNKDPDNQNSTAMDALAYNYDPDRPNRLLWVDDNVGDAPNADDLADQAQGNYHYNSIGQLIHDNAGQITYIYNASGLVAEVQRNGQPLVKFFYNDRNHRMRKETYFQGNLIYTTHYVRDVAGQVMAVYSDVGGNLALAEQPVYGSGRIGVAYANGNNAMTYVYELTDHLGNVRAVFTKNGNGADLEGHTDYYPFGMPMPGRNMIGDYRYNYQGQEKDDETEKEAFELRLWDGRIGRWLTTDPMGEFASPYIGMGNNPISRIDPTGGSTDGCCDDDWVTNRPNQLDGVTVTAGNGSWTSEMTRYGYSGSFSMWKQEFNRTGSYLQELQNWEAEHGDDFRKLTAQWDKEEQNRRTLEKLMFFTAAYGTIGQVVSPGSLPTAKPFGFRGVFSPQKASLNYAEGSFSTFNWQGYPAGGPKPTGPFRLLQGADYSASRAAANKINAALHRANPQLKSLHIHEIQPIKFAGSPTNLSNKLYLTPAEHAQYTKFWNSLMRSAQ